MPQTLKIVRFSPLSLAKVLYYVFCGLFSSVVNLFAEKEAWHVPLGFWTLFLAGKINITFHTGESPLAKVGFVFWSLVCFGITG